MADIKMDFNGDVSIEKMFDIHNNQQVTIYNNSNMGKKENPNNPQEEIAGEGINFPSNVFCITELHQTYWKEFCDAYYLSLGLLQNENSTYEQKYETFCQLQGKQTERKDYTENGLTVKEEDFKFLKFLEKRLYTLKEREELISTLYYYVRTIWSVRRKIKNDIWVIRNINPYCTKADYSQYILDETKRFAEGDKYWPIIRDVLKYPMNEEMLKEMLGEASFFEYTRDDTLIETIEDTGKTFKYNPAEGSVIFLVNEILEATVQGFNTDLHELTTLLSDNNKCTDGKEQQFFLYRFFMSYESSLPEIKNMLEELPSPLNLNRLQKEHNRLISFFSKTPLGNQWIQWLEYEDGIKHVAKYFMNKKNNLTMEEKSQFFYTLDKICIIEEILQGNTQKYGLKVDYPEDWFATEKGDKNENKETKEAEKRREADKADKTVGEDFQKELFHFVHPALEEDEGRKVDKEVENLVKRFDLQLICMRLNQLKKEGKVLLPSSPLKVFNELQRMGLPTDEKGFNYKTFCKYYNVN